MKAGPAALAPPPRSGQSDPDEAAIVLDCRGLRTYFHTRNGLVKAVDGVDIQLRAGRSFGLVGESGSGKSLTAFSILRLVDAPGRIEDGSEIRFGDIDLTTADEDTLAGIRGQRISMIFQEPMTALNPVHTVGHQIAEPLRRHMKMGRQEAIRRAVELLGLVGIKNPEMRVNDYPHQLSGGMRQRVMIAMALACSPRILLADEPTTALDVTVQAQILRLLVDLRRRFGMAILLITHDLGVVADACDDMAVMYAGRIVERGAVKEVLSNPSHPYTRALLASMPTLDGDTELSPIQGMVPDPRNWPRGCRFLDRCPHAHERCRMEYPPFFPSSGGEVACWLFAPATGPDSGQ